MDSLADSRSLHLRRHATDPVPWRPWCDEAFAEAAARDVPVLLSVGRAACPWCRAMQRESFRDPVTAATIAEGFVPVKVDRDERPDVDALYMDYVLATTGRGGWPMTVFLTPDRVPLLGGTYFPKDASGHVPGLTDVLSEVARAYANDRGRLAQTSADALAFLREMAAPKRAGEVDAALVENAANLVLLACDQVHGGFGEGAKFPRFSLLLFLARFTRLQGDRESGYVMRHALESMLRGGIFDGDGGGIARYAAERDWNAPCPEKTLCDNGMLLRALTAAHLVEPSDEFARAATLTAGWLEREMLLDGGLYAASLDAGGEDAAPARDDAAIVSWNALTARGLVEAGSAFGDEDLAARGCALTHSLLAHTREGVVHVLDDPAVADVRLAEDHAHLAAAALAAHEASGDAGLLAEARRLHAETARLFLADGVVWMTPEDSDLPVRPRESNDDPVPSGAAIFAETEARLARLDGDSGAEARAAELLRGWWAAADYAPQSIGAALALMTERVWGDAR